jgi:class 3 adenylate cyclase
MADTARIQYLYLDIVRFTKDRSVEAQSEIVAALNTIVRASLRELEVPNGNVVLLPTGDGIAIALFEASSYDLNLRLALDILRRIDARNRSLSDKMRQFDVRIGLNENVDNVVNDINGNRNVAGNGISMSQRIMDKADGGQILAGQAVYETLSPRETYMSSFKTFAAAGKHGIRFPVHQYISTECAGLNIDSPTIFRTKAQTSVRLTKVAAYAIGLAQSSHEFLISRNGDGFRDEIGIVLICLLAEDCVTLDEAQKHERPVFVTWKAETATFAEQYEYYSNEDTWVVCKLADLLAAKWLGSYRDLFEGSEFEGIKPFVKPNAIDRLRAEFPSIAETFKSQ